MITHRASNRLTGAFNNASSTVDLPTASTGKSTKPRGRSWPMWIRVSLLSLCVYIVLLVYFVTELNKHSGSLRTSHPDFKSKLLISQGKIPEPNKPSSPPRTHDEDMIAKELPEAAPKDVKHRKEDSSYQTTFYGFNRDTAESFLSKHGPSKIRKPISAYLEPPMNYTIPGTINQGKIEDDEDPGMPPQFITPIPLRTFTPDDLKLYQYPKFQTCNDLPAKLPIDRGLELDKKGDPVVWNVGNEETPESYPWDEAPYCPVDADPFLPWIHDVFPSHDATVMEFIAHNRRRCKTGRKHRKDTLRLEPQIALMQHVSVQRIDEENAVKLAPELWRQEEGENEVDRDRTFRYRLAPLEEAESDGQATRFICRFYGTDFSSGGPQSVLIEENLSLYPYNYEYVSYRKGKPTMISPKGKDNKYFWTSVIRFQCPIPEKLQEVILSGTSILSDGTPTLHVDLIPIRTPPRFGIDDMYLTEDMIGPRDNWRADNWHSWRNGSAEPPRGFDPRTRWGSKAVLPRVEASGRWVNLPICQVPSLPEDDDNDKSPRLPAITDENVKGTNKPQFLSACLWASSSFKTRGKGDKPILDTGTRLREWIEFHLLVGFDHIYVFDNSGAHTNQTSLAPILDDYPKSQISRIEWPSIVCNNNIPAHDSTGERSSQYAAENACRTRFAPFTEWISHFDTDEYLVPMGEHTSMRQVLREAQEKGTNILTFRSSRARLLYERSRDTDNEAYREMLPNLTFMEAYNCDSSPVPKPEWAERARKQIYRADYVPYHYVHYSTVTRGLMRMYKDSPKSWRRAYNERTERVTDDANEATMLHTKTTTPEQTTRWKKRCHYQFEKKWRGCYVGFAWPKGIEDKENNHNEEGMEYNCFVNPRIENYWLPKLKEALERRKQILAETNIP